MGAELDGLPFSDVDANGRPTGFSIELIRAIADREGFQLIFDMRPWEDLLSDFRKGQVQVLATVAHSRERSEFIDFSLRNVLMQAGLFFRQDEDGIRSAADLAGRRTAVLERSHAHEFLERGGIDTEIVPTDSFASLIDAVRTGRADAALSMALVTQRFIRDNSIDDVDHVEYPAAELSYALHIGVQKGETELLRRINDGLLTLHRDGTYDTLYEEWLGNLKPRKLGLHDLEPYLLPAAVVVALIAAAFVWQRRLLARVSRQAKEIRRSEERLKLVFEGSTDAFWDWDVKAGRVERSGRWAGMLGYSPEEISTTSDALLSLVHPEDVHRLSQNFRDLLEGRVDQFEIECRARTKDGGWKWILDRGKVVARDPDGRALRITGTHSDITARKQAEEEGRRLVNKMQETQKLESLGVLAGGIAHDFNNLLTVILGNAALCRFSVGAGTRNLEQLDNIQTAANRAADLCRQLLAYAGKGSFSVEKTDLNELVRETTRLLDLTLAKRAKLEFALAGNLPAVHVDPSQIRQVIMNLVINAAEAVTGRTGTITLATAAHTIEKGELDNDLPVGPVPAGEFVSFEVSDDGIGMRPEVTARIFDPFFTTKFTGRGLGLAAVLGIVRTHGGALRVSSQPGTGSTFKVFLPVSSRTSRNPFEDATDSGPASDRGIA